MGYVVLQIGQCGNQIGQAFWQAIDSEVSLTGDTASHTEFVDRSGAYTECSAPKQWVPRGLLIDSEPKAVQATQRHAFRSLQIPSEQCLCQEGGAGNVWAKGYSIAHAAPQIPTSAFAHEANAESLLEQTMSGVRRLVEASDSPSHFLTLSSLGGGSGSGIGSAVLERLRDTYPARYLAALAVSPASTGDSPCQALNCALAGSVIQEHADCALLVHNSTLLTSLAACTPGAPPTTRSLNAHIANALAGILLPGGWGCQALADVVTYAAPDPALKFAELHAAPVAGQQRGWREVARGLGALTERFDGDQNAHICGSALLVARGATEGGVGRASAEVLAPFLRHSGWRFQDESDVALTVRHGFGSANAARSLSAVANRSSSGRFWEQQVVQARAKLSAGAYVHWYEESGCSRADLAAAVDAVEDVAAAYRWAFH